MLTPAQLPNLGVLVYQLRQCTNRFLSVYEIRKFHLSKLDGLSDLSVDDLKQVIVAFFSSPEHEVLMVSYCGQWLSVVRRRPSSVVRQHLMFTL